MSGPRAWYLEMARLTMRGADPQPAGGQQGGQHVASDGAGQVDDGGGDDARCLDDLVAGCLPGDDESRPVGVCARGGAGGVGHGGAQQLVGDEQGVDLLVDPGGGAGAQHAPAEDGGLQLEVGGLDLPAFVVEADQAAGRVAVVVAQGGDEPVIAGPLARGGGDGDLGVDDPHRHAAEP